MPVFVAHTCLRRVTAMLFSVTVCTAVAAADTNQKPALPEPLTLEYALSLLDDTHPRVQVGKAGIERAKAGQLAADAIDGVNVNLQGNLRYVSPPSYAIDQTNDDHNLELSINKPLYDFGYSTSLEAAANQELQSKQYYYLDVRQQQKLEIMRRFFEVVLADLQFYRYNEEMAVEFISLDKLKDQLELGQVSDIEVLEQDAVYQRVRHLRFQSQNEQRASRARLAIALNRPGQLPSTVAQPTLPQLLRKLPEVEDLQMLALEKNPQLLALRAQLAAARSRVASARSSDNPVVTGSAQAGVYTKERSGYDDWRAELSIKIPLATGGTSDAAVATEQAAVYELQANYEQTINTVQQQVLELWLQLDALNSKRDQAKAQQQYRELYLDRSRALYELEVKTDLGDAMVRVSEAEYEAMATDFQIVLAWEQLDALTGQMELTNTPQHEIMNN